MRAYRSQKVLCLLFISLAAATLNIIAEDDANDEFRTWRARGIPTVEARLLTDQGLSLTLETREGKKIQVPFDRLGGDDKAFVRDWRQQHSQQSFAQARVKVGLKPIEVPVAKSRTTLVADYLTGPELAVIEEMNLARTDPAGYAQYLGAPRKQREGEVLSARDEAIEFLLNAKRLPPLAPAKALSLAARDHAEDTGPKGMTGHVGSDKSTFSERIQRYNKSFGGGGENISYGVDGARAIVIQLIVDDGVPDRGHRKNIFGASYKTAGVAIGAHKDYRTMCVIDFSM